MFLGGGFYTILVQGPALAAIPAPARGPAMGQIGPRQVFYLLRLMEFTILTGFLRIIVSGRGQEMSSLSSRWAISITVGLVLSLVLLYIGHGILKPGLKRMLTLGPKAAQGDQAAAQEAGALVARFTGIGYAQLAIGAVIVGSMVLARLS